MKRRSTRRPRVAPLRGELRYGLELTRLLARGTLLERGAGSDPCPVLLIPGFMAGDTSLSVLRRWLARGGHRVSVSGLRVNVDCAERITSRLEGQLQALASEAGRKVFLIGQSRGGAIARCLAVRHPEATEGLVMLGSPVCDPLAVCPPVRRTVSLLARLGDAGMPRMFSTGCRDGDCCAAIWEHIGAPLEPHIRAVAVYSRSDGIVDWRACLDPHSEAFEIDSSHCGMSVHADVYALLARVLDGAPTPRRSGAARRRQPRARRSAAEARA